MRSPFKRTLALACGLAAATGLIFTVAAPAQAGAGDCTAFLSRQGYVVGPGVLDACRRAESGPIGQVVCTTILLSLGVQPGHAGTACQLGRV